MTLRNLNLRKLKLGWKYRRQLWKYRKLIRNRRTIAAAAAGLLGVGAVILLRGHVKPVS